MWLNNGDARNETNGNDGTKASMGYDIYLARTEGKKRQVR